MKPTIYPPVRCFLALLALALASMTLLPAAVRAESSLDFKLVNDTGYEINKVFIAPSQSDDWGDDVLGKGVRLGDGQSAQITFHPRAESVEHWDLQILFNDGEYRYWRNLDLSKISEVTIHYKDNHATATWK
jgi:hypothetical protein